MPFIIYTLWAVIRRHHCHSDDEQLKFCQICQLKADGSDHSQTPETHISHLHKKHKETLSCHEMYAFLSSKPPFPGADPHSQNYVLLENHTL